MLAIGKNVLSEGEVTAMPWRLDLDALLAEDCGEASSEISSTFGGGADGKSEREHVGDGNGMLGDCVTSTILATPRTGYEKVLAKVLIQYLGVKSIVW